MSSTAGLNQSDSGVPESKHRWFEPAMAILMGATSLCTAWCSYQSSLWSGMSSSLSSSADKLQRQAFGWHLESQQVETTQVAAFFQLLDAKFSGNVKMEEFFSNRFGAELGPAYEKWLATKPFDDPKAPPHPFVPEFYTPRYKEDIRAAAAQARGDAEQAMITGKNASAYLSNTVLLATVLFFAGTASKFDQRHVRQGSLAFATALFIYALIRALMLPVA